MAKVGRPPGDAVTRDAILNAAHAAFVEQGYTATTIRGVARAAGVDPALVYHYFGGKPALFVATLHLPADPRSIKQEVRRRGFSGGLLVERFLAQWEGDPDHPGGSFVALAQAVSSPPDLARGLREFLTEQVWSGPPPGPPGEAGPTPAGPNPAGPR